MINPWEIVCFTGHRTLTDSSSEGWVRRSLTRAAGWLRERAGTRVAICGMARGPDLWWGAAALDAGLNLWAYIPFEEQAARWSVADQREWLRLRAAATRERERVIGVVPAGIAPGRRSAVVNGLLHQRNGAMLHDAGAVLTVWEPGRFDGGTNSALIQAARRRMPGVHLDPLARTVAFELPVLDRLVKYVLYHQRCGHVAATGAETDVKSRCAALRTAGHPFWRVRRGRPRETVDDGCELCRVDLPEDVQVHTQNGPAA